MDFAKILVVDDVESVVKTVRAQLTELNPKWNVIPVTSGKKCLSLLDTEIPDLVLLDIMMPDMDGWEVMARMHAHTDWKKIPIIFLTAKTDELTKSLSTVSVADYIPKPYDMYDLNNRIKTVITSTQK